MMIALTILALCLCTCTLAGELFEPQANAQNTKASGATIKADPFQQRGLCRRWAHQSTVKNGTLYMFGGSMLLKQNNTVQEVPNTEFLQLDLAQSFQLSENTVPWQKPKINGDTIPPAFSAGAMYSGKGDFVFLYEGQTPKNLPEQPSSMWGYSLINRTWQMTDRWNHADENFPNRQSRGASVMTSDGNTGFYIGGLRAYENDTFKGWYYGPEEQFTVIDLAAGKKSKMERLPLGQKRIGPNVVYLPIGKKGSLVLVGGTGEYKVRLSAPVQNATKMDGINPDDVRLNPMSQMDTIWIYDIDAGRWFYQTAVGDKPWERKNFCMVAATSDPDSSGNKTHHIFIYGGGTDYMTPMFGMNDKPFDDMYILSLPAFRYYQVKLGDVKPDARQRMTCHVVNNKQMLVLGGHRVNSSETLKDCRWDELNLFDMNTLKWQTEYNPSDPGDSKFIPNPDVIAALGAKTQEPALGWEDEDVKCLFTGICPGEQGIEAQKKRSNARWRKWYIAVGGAGGALIMALIITMLFLRRRRKENKALRYELEQLQLYFQYQTTGEIYSSTGVNNLISDGDAFVSEKVRPMTFGERVKFVFGKKGSNNQEIPTIFDLPSEKRRETEVEKIP
ncbi:hypothetical protein B9Z19DRAFT_1087559 [Tuber borchii]|uniref:Kelch repeat protein n=1 Tax=Tuber borchii TaxID=42251 RepID=A0A2T6ZMX1_TUBBO|nr:hypothetical protein B9Z19DRAFT_1087559 [Tuber borchii]